MKARILLAVALSAVSLPAFADETKQIGRWGVMTGEDAFSDKNGKNVVLGVTENGNSLGIRCMSGDADIVVVTSSLSTETGAFFNVSFRADKNPIVEGYGQAMNANSVLSVPAKSNAILFQQILHGKRFAVRLQGEKQGATVSFSLAGIDKVRDLFPAECLAIPKDDASSNDAAQ